MWPVIFQDKLVGKDGNVQGEWSFREMFQKVTWAGTERSHKTQPLGSSSPERGFQKGKWSFLSKKMPWMTSW